jgi:uncharacterized protein YdhG (YjbR/CyaY superfamily)
MSSVAAKTVDEYIASFPNGHYLIYFAGYKSHIGLYPVHVDGTEFGAEISRYASGKATLKFPLDQPLPLDLMIGVSRTSRWIFLQAHESDVDVVM